MIAVSEWVPSYGDPHELEEGGELAQIFEHDQLEAVDLPEQRLPLAFVDGVRRGEAFLYLDCGTALAGAFGAGSVLRGGFGPVRQERIFLSPAPLELPPQKGGWVWRSLPLPPELEPEMALHRAMREAEAELALALHRQGQRVVLDGPLHGVARVAGLVGYVKTQQRSLLSDQDQTRLQHLRGGQRSSLFHWGERFGCYLRLCDARGHQHPYFGLVRLETVGEAEASRALLHEVAASLLAYAGVAHLDPRAPQNLQPIAALEKELRRRLGDSGLALRAVREAVAHLQKEERWSESA